MFFDETFELTAGHALRANVGHCDLYILRHELGNYAHELDGMRPRRCHQRWLAESSPRSRDSEKTTHSACCVNRSAPPPPQIADLIIAPYNIRTEKLGSLRCSLC